MAEWIWRRFASLSAFAAAAATVRGTWLRAAIVAGLAAASLAAGPAFAQLSPVTISKSFGAGSIPLGGTTSLSFTISNATGPGFSTNIAFTDNLPAGLVVATPSGLTIPDNTVTGCDGGIATATAGSSTVSFSTASLQDVGFCTISLNVTGITAGVKSNSVTVTSAGGGNTATASLTVNPATAPTLAKSFGAASIAVNGSTSLTFTINNPNSGLGLTGVAFTDTFPSGLVVAAPNALTSTGLQQSLPG